MQFRVLVRLLDLQAKSTNLLLTVNFQVLPACCQKEKRDPSGYILDCQITTAQR